MNVKFALDIGYWAVKGCWGLSEYNDSLIFPAVVGSPDEVNFSLGLGDTKAILLREPIHAMVGLAALRQSRFISQRRDPTWVTSTEWYTLFLAALTELTQALTYDLDMVVGLPVSHYRAYKDAVRDKLQATHVVVREGRDPQRFTVHEVRVIPQTWGITLDQAIDDNLKLDTSWLQASVLVIDSGGNTTNLLELDGLEELPSGCHSMQLGAMDITSALQDRLDVKCPGLELRTHKLSQAVQRRSVMYDGKMVDITAEVDSILIPMARNIASQATQRWGSTVGQDHILIGGGAGAMLGPYLQEYFPRAVIVRDPVRANARGFYKLCASEE